MNAPTSDIPRRWTILHSTLSFFSASSWLIAIGCVLRTGEFIANRAYWLDEMSLHANLKGGLFEGLARAQINNQLAPPLFLWLERLLVQVFGESRYVTRALPFVASLIALPLFRTFATALLPRFGALLALALFAFSDELIYFSAELKPYAVDVAAALIVVTVWIRFQETTLSSRHYLSAFVLGGTLLWLSLPVCFVLATVGLLALGERVRQRRWREACACTLVGAGWLLSFAAMHRMASAMLGDSPGMWTFWDFAFPPAVWVDPLWILRRCAFLFVSPLDFHGPIEPRISAAPAIACAIVGIYVFSRKNPRVAWLTLGPILLAFCAAAWRRYPFHGRCVLFLLPSLLILIAAGAERLTRARPRWLRWLLCGLLLANPVWRDAANLTEPRYRSGLHPHGDRRPWWFEPDMFGTFPRAIVTKQGGP